MFRVDAKVTVSFVVSFMLGLRQTLWLTIFNIIFHDLPSTAAFTTILYCTPSLQSSITTLQRS